MVPDLHRPPYLVDVICRVWGGGSQSGSGPVGCHLLGVWRSYSGPGPSGRHLPGVRGLRVTLGLLVVIFRVCGGLRVPLAAVVGAGWGAFQW